MSVREAKSFGTKTDRVYQALRRMIINLELEPGALINKEDLTDQFGVSRAPVNEALSRLREEDLVNIARQHGSFVSPISLEKLEEGVLLRRAVEPSAMMRLALVTDEPLRMALHDNLAKQEKAVAAGDLSALHALDDLFHGILLEGAQMSTTLRLIRTFSAHLERARNMAEVTQRQPRDTLNEHRNLVKALEARDPHWAASAMDNHLASALMPLMAQIKDKPSLFDGREGVVGSMKA
ncbi:MAG: GntR family transcriptional regulator [Pseudomonadota bacterium]